VNRKRAFVPGWTAALSFHPKQRETVQQQAVAGRVDYIISPSRKAQLKDNAMPYTKERRDRLARVIEMQRAGTMRSFLLPGYDHELTAIDLEHNIARLAAIDRMLPTRRV
jgi:hypothetical protein